MRRKTRRHFANLILFFTALSFIIYRNRPLSLSSTTFSWTTIRYQTSSTTLPPSLGACPNLSSSTKPALIVSHVAADGDPSWLNALTPLYHICTYTADAPTNLSSPYLQVPQNRGHEAMAYLTFIIDNYEHIPPAGAVFVHGSRWAWHNDAPDYDNAALLAQLNVSAALEKGGYHNLKCDWGASMCEPGYGKPQGSLEVQVEAALEPWNKRAVSDAALAGALEAIFGEDGEGRVRIGRADRVTAQCCAQFVVGREKVWQRGRGEYVALRQWLLDGSSDGHTEGRAENGRAAPSDDPVAGRILSYLWHILFLQPDHGVSGDAEGVVDLERLNDMACPRAEDCYCRLYGRCGLEGCESPGHCRGQYVLPKDFRLPANWAATHS